MSSIKSLIPSTLYTNSTSVSQSTAEGLTALRAANSREAAANAIAAGLVGRQFLATNANTDMTTLSNAAKQAKDVRGDLAANNATMLKILEQLQLQTAMLSSLLHLHGSAQIQGDSVTTGSTSN